MPITAADIKLLESERMTDASDGGGRRRNVVIPDGIAGNVFPKVSRLDATYGRVNLRKVFGAVTTPNLDVYAGAHAAITDAPDNNKIHVSLFSTGSDFDVRTGARDRIESYVVAGPESRMILYGRQLVGQQAVLVYQRVEEPLPEVGDVFALSKEVAGNVVYQQYIRVTDIEHEVRTFTDEGGDFTRRVVTIKIGGSLRYEFAGPEVPARQSNVPREAKVRVTTVADAARYYGITKLPTAANQNDLSMVVNSIYTPIVPTTQRESPVSLAELVGSRTVVPGETLFYRNFSFQGNVSFGTNLQPGSVIVRHGFSTGGAPVAGQDDGFGTLVFDPLGDYAGQSGTVDYETGRINMTIGFISDIIEVSARAAGWGTQPAHSRSIEITLGNRGAVYSQVLDPLPAAGSVIVDYRALGRWYRLRDDGEGGLSGDDPALGSGSVNYATGALVFTLGALPDVESSVIMLWGSPIHYEARTGANADASQYVKQKFTLANTPIQASSLTLTYVSNGANYAATTNASGVISGSGLTGKVNATTGEVEIEYTARLPDTGSTIACAYNQIVPPNPGDPPVGVTENHLLDASFTLAQLPQTNSVRFLARVLGSYASGIYRSNFDGTVLVTDDGAGSLVVAGGQRVAATFNIASTASGGVTTQQTIGTINYATGECTLNATIALEFPVYIATTINNPPPGSQTWTQQWQSTTQNIARDVAFTTSVAYRPVGVSSQNSARTENITQTTAPLLADLTATVGDYVVPGSVRFSLGYGSGATRKTYYDRSGTLYADINDNTGVGIVSGTINYATGQVQLTRWGNDDRSPYPLTVDNCTTGFGEITTWVADFRTAGSPLRPASLFIQATDIDGNNLTATADQNGVITGAKARGEVNQTMGTVHIEWGEMVTAAGNEAQFWYNPANVVSGQIWRPTFVFANTVRYSAVVISNLPLNADLLGLDPVRLPADGRVPIFRPADVVVIHNTKTLTLPNPVVANTVYNVGRVALSDIWLVDQNNVKVSDANYTVNLLTGDVTMAASLNLTGLVQPLKARHRQEELNLLSDVQINGYLGFTQPLARDYDATDTYVSSALPFGDMQARATNLFDQATWTGVWSDTLIGSQATGQYNNIDYPIEVLNNGCVTERWRINFTSTTAFQVIGENLGVIATGTTGADLTVNNPLTGLPYFVLRAAGWGAGWSVGNQLRFNTIGATAPIWIARVILPGATLAGDSFDMQLRGDVDA